MQHFCFASRNEINKSKLAAHFELDREVVEALLRGKTRKGTPYPVKHHIALACAAVEAGLDAL